MLGTTKEETPASIQARVRERDGRQILMGAGGVTGIDGDQIFQGN